MKTHNPNTVHSKGRGSKAFGSTVRDARFLRHFCVPSNIVKYDGKTYPSIWLEDYCLACKAGRVDDDLFIIQFHPIYLANSTSTWLDD
jgi:hypothetical protein